MRSRNRTGITWTNLELTGLLEDEDSCVYQEKVQKHLALHPFHLTDLNTALHEILDRNLNSYDSDLNGLVLAYKNPKLLSPFGDILYDTHYVHVDVEADFYIFRPEVGKSMKGFVNKKSTNHIGILVHKTFNVSVPKPESEERGEYMEEGEAEWLGDNVKVGQEIRFTPDVIEFNSRLPYIRGSLHEEDYLRGCQLFNAEIAAEYETEIQESIRNSFSENLSGSKKKLSIKSENKRITFDSDSEVEVDPDSDVERKPAIKNVKVEPTNSSKKRKRKSSTASESETEVNLLEKKDQKVRIKENILLNGDNDSKFEIPRKPSKKRKKNLDENTPRKLFHDNEEQNASNTNLPSSSLANSSTDTESEMPSVKKKKHKKELDKVEGSSEFERIADELESSQVNEKKSKKHKKKKEVSVDDTEDEGKHKLTIDKSLSKKLNENGSNEIESKTPSKKRKSSCLDDEILNDTEDERNYKKSLRKSISELGNDAENESEGVPKKKRKKHKDRRPSTEFIDDRTMDTEDERQYKSSLKELVHTLNPGDDANGSEFKTPKVKKLKKSRKSSHTETETSIEPSLVKVKEEPESETEEQRHMRRKKKREEKLRGNSLSSTHEENDVGSLNNTKNGGLLNNVSLNHSVKSINEDDSSLNEKLRPEVKSEEEQELKKKLKKEKRVKESGN